MLDLAETARLSFQAGPVKIRKYARLFGVVTNVIICLVHYQAAVIYILYVATSFQQVQSPVILASEIEQRALSNFSRRALCPRA